MRKVEFLIEYIFESPPRKSPQLLAKQLTDKVDFQITEGTKLGDAYVKEFQTVRSVDKEGNPKYDLFAFRLADKKALDKFTVGMIVKLSE